ncbi:MAG: hypothetical protein NZ521_03670 [Flammeovirgaceae bacterium]|nr:hypothetical protein [Flammeovirgaceae bacterium]MDW8287271.1 hypothetical protein [Flammeovirgaceae bacterium]
MNVFKKYIAYFLLIISIFTISISPFHQEGACVLFQKTTSTAEEDQQYYFKKLELASPQATKTVFLLVRTIHDYLPSFFYFFFDGYPCKETRTHRHFVRNYHLFLLLRYCIIPQAP